MEIEIRQFNKKTKKNENSRFFLSIKKQLDKNKLFVKQTYKNIEKLNEVLKIICCFIFNDVLK